MRLAIIKDRSDSGSYPHDRFALYKTFL
jgi:hypothetical protein